MGRWQELGLLLEERGVYKDMRWWEAIRRRVLRQGVSKRQILRETRHPLDDA